VENLNETKVSNVVKENHIILSDQKKAVQEIQQMLVICGQLVVDEVRNMRSS
jgi:hypothetical protein